MSGRLLRASLVMVAACHMVDPPARPADTDAPPADTDTDGAPPDTDPDADTDGEPVPAVTLSWGAEVVCADPAAREIAALSAPVVGGAWADQRVDPENRSRFTGGGVSAADLDGDGALDLIRPEAGGVRLWLQTAPSIFADATAALPEIVDRTNVVTAADVDGDADLDLFVGRHGAPNRLWINDGTGRFTDGTAASGVVTPDEPHTTSAAFADYDLDGDLDLLLGNYGSFADVGDAPGESEALWRNRGDGTFEDASAALPDALHDGYTFVAGWWDLDRDRWPDVYTVNDFGFQASNVLVHNAGGLFTADANALGLDVKLQGMGLGIGDLNQDGVDDAVMAGWNHHRVMVSSGGVWFDAQEATGFDGAPSRRQSIGWAAEMADLDNDGDLDVAMGFGHIRDEDAALRQPDEIFLFDGAAFTPVGQTWGFDHEGTTRGVLAVDANGDGWLDLLRAEMTGPATLQLAACGGAAWTSVVVRDDRTPNRFGVGVELIATAGARTWTRTVVAGGRSVMSSGPPIASFGFGDVEVLDSLTVQWTDGEVTVFTDVPTRRPLTVRRAP